MKEYMTSDLWIATTIYYYTQRIWDETIVINGDQSKKKVVMKWFNLNTQLLQDIKNGHIRVEPIAFGRTAQMIRKRIFQIIEDAEAKNGAKKMEQKNDKKRKTSAAN